MRFQTLMVSAIVPYPVGPTDASNNKLYCRIHHLRNTLRWLRPQCFPRTRDVGGSARDSEEPPLARHALELVSATVVEFES
jgi:hypothetical protein